MKRLLLAAALLLATPHTDAAVPRDQAIVPGKSIGKVWLGATRPTVRKILGKPGHTFTRKGGIVGDEWLGPAVSEKDSWAGVRQRSLIVLYQRGRVVQIEANSPTFRTKEGISTKSSLGQFRKYFRPTLRAYLHADPEGGGYRAYFYDDVRRGLAFTFGAQDQHDARVLPEYLRVHRPGTRAIPDPGGVRKNYRDEIPVQKQPI